MSMLALGLRKGEYAFVYNEGRPIGAILVRDANRNGRFALGFSGEKLDFEILRPSLVESRFGPQELTRLIQHFLPDAPSTRRTPGAPTS